MTCIAAIETDIGIAMGADSYSCDADDGGVSMVLHKSDPKIFAVGHYLIGVAGPPRFANVVRFQAKLGGKLKPTTETDESAHHTVVTHFAKNIRKACEHENLKMHDEGPMGSSDVGDILVAYSNRLFLVDSSFAVERAAHGFNAIGSGAASAMGALFALRIADTLKSPCGYAAIEGNVAIALQASSLVSPFVRSPFRVYNTWGPQTEQPRAFTEPASWQVER